MLPLGLIAFGVVVGDLPREAAYEVHAVPNGDLGPRLLHDNNGRHAVAEREERVASQALNPQPCLEPQADALGPPQQRGDEPLRGVLAAVSHQVTELRSENECLEAQLDSATTTMDRLRERRDFYSKTTSALKGLVTSNGIEDDEVLAAYDRVGVKAAVLEDRERRKRKRDIGEGEEAIVLED